jgi:acetyltransferase-like isoleucine patch superfamily enzyme
MLTLLIGNIKKYGLEIGTYSWLATRVFVLPHVNVLDMALYAAEVLSAFEM